ncbi:MAG: hypothetical protein VBE63_26535 [Lamprobacter sp.]|uniref:hypothetical protein n=1 Tax=Lamprobacter sp. TaxID=3100796 RepID=UPI002B261E8B|nr:hypothetical protein [Lamprobacter sp.]MEA3643462.1 hypothetical protein [Lamprobacter sp.]
MDEATSNSQNRVPPKPWFARDARYRGQFLAELVCCWVQRWGYTSDQVLEYMYPPRPRLGYDLSRRGLLKRHKRPTGVSVKDGIHVYSLTDAGYEIAEDILSSEILRIEHSASPAWSIMQHLLDCQRISIALLMRAEKSGWRTEPESRAVYPAKAKIVPDIVDIENGHWIEYDKTPKENKRLDYWTQLLSRRINQQPDPLQKQRGCDNFAIRKITVVVRKDDQVDRYRRYFDREYAGFLYRDPDTRLIKENRDKPNVVIRDAFADRVHVTTLRDLLLDCRTGQRTEYYGPPDAPSFS